MVTKLFKMSLNRELITEWQI